MSHLYGFSPVCVLLCSFKLPLFAYAAGQTSHLKGFSPVWVFKWVLRWYARLAEYWQKSHLCDLIDLLPAWVLQWVLKEDLRRKVAPHMSQMYGSSLVSFGFVSKGLKQVFTNSFELEMSPTSFALVLMFGNFFELGVIWFNWVDADSIELMRVENEIAIGWSVMMVQILPCKHCCFERRD